MTIVMTTNYSQGMSPGWGYGLRVATMTDRPWMSPEEEGI
jgi:hypothetical protein